MDTSGCCWRYRHASVVCVFDGLVGYILDLQRSQNASWLFHSRDQAAWLQIHSECDLLTMILYPRRESTTPLHLRKPRGISMTTSDWELDPVPVLAFYSQDAFQFRRRRPVVPCCSGRSNADSQTARLYLAYKRSTVPRSGAR